MIEYRTGDVLSAPERPLLIAHVVNDEGRWGAGFSGQVGRRWPDAERSYKSWAAGSLGAPIFGLGCTAVYEVERGSVWVAHLCAQRGVGRDRKRLEESALERCLIQLRLTVSGCLPDAILVMPRIGCGLAGGDWSVVEPLVRTALEGRRAVIYTGVENG